MNVLLGKEYVNVSYVDPGTTFTGPIKVLECSSCLLFSTCGDGVMTPLPSTLTFELNHEDSSVLHQSLARGEVYKGNDLVSFLDDVH